MTVDPLCTATASPYGPVHMHDVHENRKLYGEVNTLCGWWSRMTYIRQHACVMRNYVQ